VFVVALASCRLHFDPLGGADDGSLPGSGDGSGGTGIDGAEDRPNRVFITTATMTGAFGGLAAADAMCRDAAIGAGLPGTFVAWLSTSTSNIADRLAGSRGWLRTDNVPVLDSLDALAMKFEIFAPIDHDASGVRVPFANLAVWTGTDSIGRVFGGGTCNDWASTAVTGETGELSAGDFVFTEQGSLSCANDAHLYCFEIGHDVGTLPGRIAGTKVAFVSTTAPTTMGIAAMDGRCQADAMAAGLPGMFLAAVATKTASIANRFTPGTSWVRVDGVEVGAVVDGTDPLAFVTQRADGTYLGNPVEARTGSPTPTQVGTNASTCNDWSSGAGGGGTLGRLDDTAAAKFWGFQSFSCGFDEPVLCLQL
jgi:hypothetical protein